LHAAVAALSHQHPKVKELTLQWLCESVNARETKPTIIKLAPLLLPAVAKCAEDAVPGIREGGFTLMVTFAVKVCSILGVTCGTSVLLMYVFFDRHCALL
jgi:hypothetical protein